MGMFLVDCAGDSFDSHPPDVSEANSFSELRLRFGCGVEPVSTFGAVWVQSSGVSESTCKSFGFPFVHLSQKGNLVPAAAR